MDLSYWPGLTRSWDEIVEGTEYAERTGWHGVWFADHFMDSGGDLSIPMLECFGVLAALAAKTERLRIGSMVAGNTYRHPAVLANQAAAIHVISQGRFVFGVGAGWQANEHEAYGIELPPTKQLLARFDEACQVWTSLLHKERTTFHGTYYQLTDAPLEPKPEGMPLLIGAAGEKVALGIVARYADEWNHWGTPETAAHKGKVFAEHCERIGRDPATVRRSTQAIIQVIDPHDTEALRRKETLKARALLIGTEEEVLDAFGRYAEAGIDEFGVPDTILGSGAQRLENLERIRETFARL